MHYTINGCYYSDIKVLPKNWKTKKSLKPKEKWLVYYRFYDPVFKDTKSWGQLIRFKGMNETDDIDIRKQITKDLIEQEHALLQRRFWNPVTGKNMMDTPSDRTNRFTLRQALMWGYEKLDCIQQTKNDILSVINGFLAAAETLYDTDLLLPYDKIPVRQFSRSKVYATLDKCFEMNDRFTNKRYNRYKDYLSSVFRKLLKYEIVESNVMRDIEKKKTIKTMQKVLTLEEEQLVNDHIRDKDYEFWRFMQIFFYADARETELMKVRKDDRINIAAQEFQVTILKGKNPEDAMKQISNEVVDLWKELLQEAKEGDYLFSKGLKPGPVPIRYDQINRRWSKLVKRPKAKGGLGINKDFRTLNHSHLTKVSKKLGIETAAGSRNHKTPIITMKHYDVEVKQRMREEVRNSGVKLGS
jgi:hypothetical protein